MCVSLLLSIAGFSENIQFADQNVKNICVQNWDTNGDGELSLEEAAAVTDIGSVFQGQWRIYSFDEFRYFTGVTAIPNDAFNNCYNMSSIIIPQNVTSIGERAFQYCSALKTIDIPQSVTTIGEWAFVGCGKLVSFSIPASVTSLANYFVNGQRLAYIVSAIADPTPVYLSTDITSEVVLYVPAGTKAKYQNTEGWSWFNNIIEGEPTLTQWGGLNFLLDTSGHTATVIGGDYQDMNDITIPASLTYGNEQYSVKTVGRGAFSQCYNTKSITIPEGITTIGEYALQGAYVSSYSLPATLKSIGENAFGDNDNCTTMTIPEGVEKIGNWAFSNCDKLNKLELPSTLTSIGTYVVSYCTALAAVVSHLTTPIAIQLETFCTQTGWDEQAQKSIFSPCDATLYVPVGTKAAYEQIEGWTKFKAIEEGEIKDYTDGNGIVYSYSTGADFATVISGDYEDMVSVVIPASITADGKDYAVKEIGAGAFYNAYNMTSLTLPNSITIIGDRAFGRCGNLTSVTIPEGVTTIGEEGFYNCNSLKKIVLPSTLTSIGSAAFYRNYNMSVVVSHIKTPFEIAENVFAYNNDWDSEKQETIYVPSPATLYIPEGTKAAYENFAGWKMFSAIEEGEVKDVKVGDLNFMGSTKTKTATLISCDVKYEKETAVTIPSTVTIDGDEYQVTEIGNRALYNNYRITSLTLPVSLVAIGDHAFEDLNITSITLPSTLKTIGEGAFSYTQLNSIVIPEGVTSIGHKAFTWCQKIQKLELPSTLTSIGDFLIQGCGALSSVVSRLKEPVQVSKYAFAMSDDWTDGVETITPSTATLYVPEGSKAAYEQIEGWKQFKEIVEGEPMEAKVGDLNYSYNTASDKATLIAGDYFDLTSVTIPAKVNIGGKDYEVTEIAGNTFYTCGKLTSVTISEGISAIGSLAFFNTGISEIKLPASLTSIGRQAFSNNRYLTSIVIPEGVKTIGDYAFNNCRKLQKMELPSTLTRIGYGIIQECNAMVSVVSHMEEPINIPADAFALSSNWSSGYEVLTPSTATLYVPVGSKAKYQQIEGWMKFQGIEEGEVKDVTVDGLNYTCSTGSKTAMVIAGDYGELTAVTIPATITVDQETFNVTSIGPRAFYNYNNIREVVLSEGLETISDEAFYRVRMSTIELPKSLKTIGNSAFMYCYSLAYINIPEGVTSVGNQAFYNCYNLQTMVLPATLTSIGDGMALSTTALKEVVSRIQNPFAIPETTFGYWKYDEATDRSYLTASQAVLYVPEGKSDAYKQYKGWTMFKTIEEGNPKTITVDGLNYRLLPSLKIAALTSGDYYDMTSATIPATVQDGDVTYEVKDIENHAFQGCGDLRSLTIAEGIETIGNYAFMNAGLSSLTLPTSLKSIGESAFQYCYSLTSVELPEGLTTLGTDAFYSCQKLSKIILPSTLKTIGSYLIGNTGVSAVVSHIQEPFKISNYVFGTSQWDSELQANVFQPCSATLYVPEGTKEKYQQYEGWTMFKAIEEGDVLEAVVDGLKYSYQASSDQATVIRGDYEQLENVTIPSTVTIGESTYRVTAIGTSAFSELQNLKTVTINEGITEIQERAFQSSAITQVALPNSLKSIGNEAFESCDTLQSVVIPEGVETIGDYAFGFNYELRSLTLPSTLKSLGSNVFNWNCALSAIISNITEPFAINKYTFNGGYYMKDEKEYPIKGTNAMLFVPAGTKEKYQNLAGWNTIEMIEEGTPQQAKVDDLTYQYSDDSKVAMVIRDNYSALENITVPASITVGGTEYPVKAIGGYAFGVDWDQKKSSVLKSVTLPEGITSLGIWSFARAKIENLNLPSTLNYIYGEAFNNSDLTSVVIPENVERVSNFAFISSKNLKSVVISEGVQQLGYGAFSSCTNLESLELPSTLKLMDNNLVGGCYNLAKVVSNMTEPLEISNYVFGSENWNGNDYTFVKCPATLYVPAGTKSKYQKISGWMQFADIVEIGSTETIKISGAGQVPYMSDKDLDFTSKPELKAYVATGYDKISGTIWLTRVKDVPAMTGFLLMGDEGEHEVPINEAGSKSSYKNMFKGTLEGTTIQTTDGAYTNYYLSNGESGVGFYKVTKEGGVQIGANRAYLPILTDIPTVGSAGSTETITVSAAGQVPYFNSQSLDFSSLDEQGVKAYTATGYDYGTGTIWLTRVKQVPAQTGILIMAPQGEYPVPTASVTSVYENMFKGSESAQTIYQHENIDGKDYINYYLSKGDAGVGFYRVTKEDGVSLGANRCYLPILNMDAAGTRSASSAKSQIAFREADEVIGIPLFRGIGGDEDGTTSIRNLTPALSEGEGEWYTLQGQRVAKPGKGLYIRNGKKVIVR